MYLAAQLDQMGRPAWIALIVGAFVLFHPLGFAMLAFAAITGRLGRFRAEGRGRWYNTEANGKGGRCGWRSPMSAPSSGNKAFDEYRSETLHRLEEEQKEFVDYLDRLRQAKDKQEFDQFMADRRRPPVPTDPSASA